MRLPNIGIISDERFPCNQADTQQIMKNASALVRAGVPLDLFIPRRAGRRGWTQEKRLQELAAYYGLPEHMPIQDVLTIPAGDWLRPPVKLMHGAITPFFLKQQGIEIVYTRNLLPAALCLGLGMRLIFETYRCLGDEYPRLVAGLAGLAKRPGLLGIIMHSQYAADSLVRRGVPAERILVAHNGYDPVDMEPVLSKQQARAKLNLPSDRPMVVYTGNMQASKGIEGLLALAQQLPELFFLLVGGHPSDVARLTKLARRLDLENVQFTGHRPVSEMSGYLYSADVLIVPPSQSALHAGRTVLPIKCFSYLAAGRPILAPDLPDTRELFIHDKNVCLVPADDIQAAIEALNNLTQNHKLANRLAKGAKQTAETLSWDARAQKIKDWLQERLSKS